MSVFSIPLRQSGNTADIGYLPHGTHRLGFVGKVPTASQSVPLPGCPHGVNFIGGNVTRALAIHSDPPNASRWIEVFNPIPHTASFTHFRPHPVRLPLAGLLQNSTQRTGMIVPPVNRPMLHELTDGPTHTPNHYVPPGNLATQIR